MTGRNLTQQLDRSAAARALFRAFLRLALICLVFSLFSFPARAQTPTINPQGFVNAATGRNSSFPVAVRGAIVSIYGSNFSNETFAVTSYPLATETPGDGMQVLFDGIAAPLIYVSPTQINAQVPVELPDSGSVNVVVRNQIGASAPLEVALVTQDPGIFVVVKQVDQQISPLNPILPETASPFGPRAWVR